RPGCSSIMGLILHPRRLVQLVWLSSHKFLSDMLLMSFHGGICSSGELKLGCAPSKEMGAYLPFGLIASCGSKALFWLADVLH
ncbi:hypothetical protein A2U01_0058631, partial [Trifolium medium]|nr:hypothetical protein [Trifolium medium]